MPTGDLNELAVALIFYNRPEKLQRVFSQIELAKPNTLFLISDGPKLGDVDDHEKINSCRKIVEKITWECQVKKVYSPSNLGLRNRIYSGLSEVFHEVPEAIILEDDCLPSPTFFRYCQTLLARYRDHSEIHSISGHRWEAPDLVDGPSYYFSRYPNSWGWATWANRWTTFDLEMRAWPALREQNWLETIFPNNKDAVAYWTYHFNASFHGTSPAANTWDYAWMFHSWKSNSFSIRSNINLVHNIGFDTNATHTMDSSHPIANRYFAAEHGEISHPNDRFVDHQMDQVIEWVNYSGTLRRGLKHAHQRISNTNP